MKRKTWLILLITLLISVSLNSQEVSDVSIAGSFTVGSEVVASYIIQGSVSNTLFFWYEVTATDTVEIATSADVLVIPASSYDKRLLLKVRLEDAGVVADSAFSPLSTLVKLNQQPSVSSVSVTGSLDVNDYLLGNYEYSDADGDQEGNSLYQWRLSDFSSGSPSVAISGETGRTYKIRMADQGKYILFRVTPYAKTGASPGTAVTSTALGPVNTAPTATAVTVSGTAELGGTLTGNYTYSDIDGDIEGTSVFRWYRDGVLIPGATSLNYVLATEDVNYRMKFEVIPVSATGYPDTGISAESAETVEVTDPSGDKPSAIDLCISGTRTVGSELTGKYSFSDKFSESGTTVFWFRGTSRIPLGTNQTYTVTPSDMDSELFFAVLPRNNKGVVGDTAFSQTLALINLPAETFSVADPDVMLTASPGGGVFYGQGVSGGYFSPQTIGAGGPYTINYLLSISLPTNSCTQNASDDVYVNPIESYFESFKNVYCHDGGHDTIYVSNIPAGSIDKNFDITSPAAIVIFLSDTSVIIDPSRMRPGNKVDTLFFSYVSEGSFYPMSKPFVVDSVGTALEFTNLDTAYCEGSVKRFITIEGIYPAGGNGAWSGAIVSDQTATTAFIDPSMGSAGGSYEVSYQYTSPFGCKSTEIREDISINSLPDPDFALEPTYNVDGPSQVLTPVTTGGTFVGPGVFGNSFYPSVAGQGVHEIRYYVTDDNGCSDNSLNTTVVRKAQGDFSGVPDIICYDDLTYNITIENLPAGISITSFTSKSNGLHWTSGNVAAYNVPQAGAGYDTLQFSYLWDNVPYLLVKPVFIDSIGNITIIGIKDNYCDYEGVVGLRVFVENSTGSGNFGFSGPPDGFTNYGNMADFDPSLTLPSVDPYTMSYTHISNVNSSGCLKTITYDLFVNQSPDISIIKTRTTVNIEEPPIELEGTPAEGIFSGKGVYSQAGTYVFNPAIAGLGKAGLLFTHVDVKGCYASAVDTLIVNQASGDIEGLNPANQYCYDGDIDTIRYVSSDLWIGGFFSGKGIQNIGAGVATFNPESAGKGDHTITFTYFDLMFTSYNIPEVVNVDSIGQVLIDNLPDESVFCNNDSHFQLYTNRDGGEFTGPVTGNNFDPAKGPGTEPVVYTYISSSTGCSSSVSVPVTINPAPQVDFSVADVCIESSSDTTWFINNTSSSNPVAQWLWEFRDGGAIITSDIEAPGYLYLTGGLHQIKLTAATTNNCSAFSEKTIDLGVKPEADFYWLNECYHPNDSVLLFDRTLTGSAVTSRSWNFFDGEPPLTVVNPKYPKITDGFVPVEYIVYTNYADCYDTIRKDIFIRPTIKLTSDDYYEDFESGTAGWIREEGLNNSWSFGTPDRTVINQAASGINAWYTSYDIANQSALSSSVSSPCFDFTETERPMISLKLWKRFDRNRDGAALQYKIGDNPDWEYLGTIDDGIQWYNSTLIKGRPGGDQIGWTTLQTPDTGWTESRHRLDELNGKMDVKFRIAYGSDGSSQDNEGIAFDDIRIGTRTRNVLLEHFTNNSSTAVIRANGIVNTIALAMNRDVININYHTTFPGSDQFYNDNPSDMSARVLLYGLSKVPYTFIDGGILTEFAGVFDYIVADLDSNELNRRSLISPRFIIDINPVISSGLLVVDASIKALEDLNEENLTLYITVTAREITTVTGSNGETLFRNTMRKMLPDAGGINLQKAWSRNEVYEAPDLTWQISNIYDASEIEIVAFVQNNITREVYQAVASEIKDISVGIDDLLYGEEATFVLFPNPSSRRLVIVFSEPLQKSVAVEIMDYTGSLKRLFTVEAGQERLETDNHGLENGVYMVRVTGDSRVPAVRKLVVSGR